MTDTRTHGEIGWTRESVPMCFDASVATRILQAATEPQIWEHETNDGVTRMIDAFPDRISALIGIHPPYLNDSLRRIEKYSGRGFVGINFVGIKLMPTIAHYPDGEKHRRMFEEVNVGKGRGAEENN